MSLKYKGCKDAEWIHVAQERVSGELKFGEFLVELTCNFSLYPLNFSTIPLSRASME